MNPTAATLLPEAHVGVEARVVAVSVVVVRVVIPGAKQTPRQANAQNLQQRHSNTGIRISGIGLGEVLYCMHKRTIGNSIPDYSGR